MRYILTKKYIEVAMKYRHISELGPDSIQKWCEEMEQKPQGEILDEDSLVFIMCSRNEEKMKKDKTLISLINNSDTMLSLMNKRIKEVHTYTVENSVLMFFAYMIDRPGIAVEYMNYMQYKCWKHGIRHVNMELLSEYILPMCMFSKDTLHEMWEKQKFISSNQRGLLNMLDFPCYMESIKTIEEKS